MIKTTIIKTVKRIQTQEQKFNVVKQYLFRQSHAQYLKLQCGVHYARVQAFRIIHYM